MKNSKPVFRSGLLAASLALGGISAAGATDLANIPMAVQTHAKPNVLFVYDDSGSMDFEVVLDTNDGAAWYNTTTDDFTGWDSSDTNVGGSVLNFNYGASANATWKKYTYLFPNGQSSSDGRRNYGDSTNDHYAIPPVPEYAFFRSADYNPIYYDSNTTYFPWGPSNNGTSTTTWGNITATAAPTHPAKSTSANALNLTVEFNSASSGWNTGNWTFRVQSGAVWTIPSGTVCKSAGTSTTVVCASPAAEQYDAAIPYYPATFYVKDATCTAGDAACQQFGPDGTTRLRKYEIKSGNTFPSGRAYADEMQNFANWFSYYRKRRLTMNAAMGGAINGIQSMRGGLFYYNDSMPSSMTMYDFSSETDSLNAKRLLGLLYSKSTSGSTPTKRALSYAAAIFNLTPGPVQYACQFNSAFMITDGYDNGTVVSLSPENYDGQTVSGTYPYGGVAPYTDAYSNTLADVAMKAYTERLRTDLAAGQVPVDTASTVNGADINNNLHVNTYAMGLGVKGTIFGVNTAATNDPYNTTFTWPNVLASAKIPESIDDLWHATLNGRGMMLSADNPAAAQAAIQNVLNTIIGVGSAAAVAVANANVTSGDNASYVTSYNSGTWTGDLIAYPIDLVSGVPDTASPLWTANCASAGSDGCTAQEQLDYKAAQNGNNASSVRKIVTYTGTTGTDQGRPFQASGCLTSTDCITATQQGYLNTPSGSDGAAVLSYLRGNRTTEGTTYRTRTHLLGDMINAEPVIVREPYNSFADDCYSTPVTNKCASSYKTTQASRTRVVLQAANDGMVHVFNAASGTEEWAYIPDVLLSQSRDPGNANTSTLNMLSRLSGYYHRYYIDGTPAVGDVDFSNTDGVSGSPDPDWRTIVVGGLGKGGRGFYALDLTTPTASSEADAAAKVLWEFPNSATNSTLKLNIGYSYGKPVITKTAAYGWVVLVTSGYNNGTGTDNSGGDGHGYIWVLDAKTGNVLNTIDTGVGTTGDPSGLAHIAAWADNADLDNTATYVYGGDLKGNLWRFDLTDSTGTIVYTARKLAVLKDASGVTQPVTTVPELASIAISSALTKRFVFVGTGQYLGDSDVATTQTQTMYGIVDDLSTSSNPVIADPTRDSLVAQTFTTSGTTRTVSSNAVDYTTKKGWYIDLPITGERVNTDPALALGALFFTSNIPSSAACVPGGSSWLNFLDAKTGGLIANSTETYSSISLGNALASRPVIIKLPSGTVKVLARTSDASTVTTDAPLPTSGSSTQRSSWREILD